jgi:hypothetical protein
MLRGVVPGPNLSLKVMLMVGPVFGMTKLIGTMFDVLKMERQSVSMVRIWAITCPIKKEIDIALIWYPSRENQCERKGLCAGEKMKKEEEMSHNKWKAWNRKAAAGSCHKK